MDGTRIAGIESKAESYRKYMGNSETAITKTERFLSILEEVSENLNEIVKEVARNLPLLVKTDCLILVQILPYNCKN